MDAKHFDDRIRFHFSDASRRRLLASLGSGLLGLLAPAAISEVAGAKGKKRKGKRNKRRTKERCKKLGEPCINGGKRPCCDNQTCFESPTKSFCCKAPGEPCAQIEECCSESCFEGTCGFF
jgi:hypothetical protein